MTWNAAHLTGPRRVPVPDAAGSSHPIDPDTISASAATSRESAGGVRGDQIPQRAALDLFLAMIAGAEPGTSLFEIRTKRTGVRGMQQIFVPLPERDRAIRCVANHGQAGDTYVGVAPRTRENGGLDSIDRVWCLWVDIDSSEAVHRLKDFRPLPSVVIRSGTEGHLHGYWPLSQPVSAQWAKLANRRLAFALGGDRNATDGARIMRPPLTRNFKRDQPQPVRCTRLELDVFLLGDVVAGLRDDPQDAPSRPGPPRRPGVLSLGTTATEGLLRTVRDAQEGNRNASTFWAACRLAENGAGDQELADLRAAAAASGLGDDEIDRTIASALNQQAAA